MTIISRHTRNYLRRAIGNRRHLSVLQTAVLDTVEAQRRRAEKLCHAPPTIRAIPDDAGENVGNAGAFIRPIGCSRRVFLMNPYLTPDELEGLAYRIRVLSSNEALNSVLIATDDDDPAETGAMPSSLLEVEALRGQDINDSWLFDPKPGQVWHAAGGYDPLAWYTSGKYKDPIAVASLLESIQDLAMATKGHATRSRIPIITIPHGAVTDSGYALCLSSYMIATEQTHFRISNPSRGLTFDPVGFSFILPRLGEEFKQPCARFKGCGLILGLMGYEASPEDMVETGLATHYMSNPTAVMGMLERTLAQLPPWNQQEYTKKPKRTEEERQRFKYRPPEEVPDHNAQFRNVAVASTIHAFTEYHADGSASWDLITENDEETYPAAYDFDPVPWQDDRESAVIDYAATFDEIFCSNLGLEGILEGFRDVAGRVTKDPDEQEGIDVAADFVRRLEEQAPLALRVTYKLMHMGKSKRETIESCMKRERVAQARMMAKPDFENWAKAQLTGSGSTKFTNWKHQSITDVTEDEVLEIIGMDT